MGLEARAGIKPYQGKIERFQVSGVSPASGQNNGRFDRLKKLYFIWTVSVIDNCELGFSFWNYNH